MAGTRSMDHRELNIDEIGMTEFMDMGNIRMKPEGGGFEVTQKPTPKQKAVLSQYIRDNYGEVYVDLATIGKHYSSPEYIEYKKGTPASKVIADIERYYDTGELPKQGGIADFRYSAKRGAGNEVSSGQETKDLQKNDAKKKVFEKTKRGKDALLNRGGVEYRRAKCGFI